MENMTTAFKNNIFLFSIFYDTLGNSYIVMKQTHPYDYASEIAAHDHFRLGHVVIGAGGVISYLAPATNRTIQVAGNAALDDHGVTTPLVSSGGAAISLNCLYNNASDTLSQLSRRAFTKTGTFAVAPLANAVYRNGADTYQVTVLYSTNVTNGVVNAYQSAGVTTPPANDTLTKVSGTGDNTIVYVSNVDVRTVPTIYLNAKIPTQLEASGNTNRWGIYAIFATADDLQTPTTAGPLPNYIVIPSDTAYSGTTAATAIASLGTSTPNMAQFLSPVELEALEPCLLGFVVVDGNSRSIVLTTSNGFVDGVRSYRNTGSGNGGAGAAAVSTALNVSTDSSGWTGALSAADTNVQLALNTLNLHPGITGPTGASVTGPTGPTGPTGASGISITGSTGPTGATGAGLTPEVLTNPATGTQLAAGKEYIVIGLTGSIGLAMPTGSTGMKVQIGAYNNQTTGYQVTANAAGIDTFAYDGITTYSSALLVYPNQWMIFKWAGTYWVVDDASSPLNGTFSGALTVTDVLTASSGIKLGAGTDIMSVWKVGTDWAPTIANGGIGSTAGTIVSVTVSEAMYIIFNKMCFVHIKVLITDRNDATGSLRISTPAGCNPSKNSILSGAELTTLGICLMAYASLGNALITVTKYDGSTIFDANNRSGVISGWFQIA
jgi:hypothetical protein